MIVYKDGRYRLRVKKYRVIYKHHAEKEIEILRVMDIGSLEGISK